MKKNYLATFLLFLICTPSFACSLNSDCIVGQLCFKNPGQVYGNCMEVNQTTTTVVTPNVTTVAPVVPVTPVTPVAPGVTTVTPVAPGVTTVTPVAPGVTTVTPVAPGVTTVSPSYEMSWPSTSTYQTYSTSPGYVTPGYQVYTPMVTSPSSTPGDACAVDNDCGSGYLCVKKLGNYLGICM